MYNISESKDSPTVYARLTPKSVLRDGQQFEPDAFPKWLKNGGHEYLKIKATTKEGLLQLAKANDLADNLSQDYWDQPVNEIYWDLFWRVQMKGVKDGWSCAAEEGMHRYTATISKFLCGFPDSKTGYLTVGSVKESDFTNRECGTSTKISDDDFLKMWIKGVFEGKDRNDNPIPPLDRLALAVRFYYEPDLPADEIAYASRSFSHCIMVARKESCNRSPFDIIGDMMANDVKSMNIDQASRRANFTGHVSPTYNPSESTKDITVRLYNNHLDAEGAYPWTSLYESEAYTNFIANPLDERNQTAVKNQVLNFESMPLRYHMLIREGYDEMMTLDENSEGDLPTLQPPFLPSFPSMANDVGNAFEEGSYMNPEIANGAYYGPIIITYLYAMYQNLLVHQVIDDQERVLIIRYFLRFVNNANEKNTRMEVHGTWKNLLEKEHPPYFWECQNIEMLISCTRVILDFFNSLLSIGMEAVADKRWNERRNHLTSIGNRFTTLMKKMGQEVLGVKDRDRLKVLGKQFYFYINEYTSIITAHP